MSLMLPEVSAARNCTLLFILQCRIIPGNHFSVMDLIFFSENNSQALKLHVAKFSIHQRMHK